MKAPIDRDVVAGSASFGPPSHDRTVRVSSSLGRSAASHVRLRSSPYPLDVPPDGIRFEARSLQWLRLGATGYDAVDFIFRPFGTRGSQVQILSPRPSIPAKLQKKFTQRILLLRGTANFGPQVDHDLNGGARFRGQCSLLRGRADARPLASGTRCPRVHESVLCKNGRPLARRRRAHQWAPAFLSDVSSSNMSHSMTDRGRLP